MNKDKILVIRRLRVQGIGLKKIAKEIGVSYSTVRKILIDCGDLETAESQLHKQGFSISEIAGILGKKENTVVARIPYTRCIYNDEYPTENALRIRTMRMKRRLNKDE